MNWSEEVAALIAESGKTIQEVADAVGITKRTVENWKYGKVEPNDFTKKAFRNEIKNLLK